MRTQFLMQMYVSAISVNANIKTNFMIHGCEYCTYAQRCHGLVQCVSRCIVLLCIKNCDMYKCCNL